MFDPSQVRPHLAAEFISLARRSAATGYAVGSTGEQIVGALLNGRADWLPDSYPTPLDAIVRLNQGGGEWWHTMLYVNERDWRAPIEMHEERL
jgi:hypothetical protein